MNFSKVTVLGMVSALPIASILAIIIAFRPYVLTKALYSDDFFVPTIQQKIGFMMVVVAAIITLSIALSFLYVVLLHHNRGQHFLLGVVSSGLGVSFLLYLFDIPRWMEWTILILMTDIGLGLMIPMMIKETIIETLLK